MAINDSPRARHSDIPATGGGEAQRPADTAETDVQALIPRTWITDRAWVSGLAGAVAVVACAYWYFYTGALAQGLSIGGYQLTTERIDTLLAALFIITGVMVAVEAVRLWRWWPRDFISVHPDLKQGRHMRFLGESLKHYVLNLVLLGTVIAFFYSAGEYGYQRNAAYYQPWFRFLEIIGWAYLIGGLPYVLLTRALKYDPTADRRDFASMTEKVVRYFASFIPGGRAWRPAFDDFDKKAVRGLLVKVFFAPLMTVFFCDQFPHLVSNVGYMINGIPDALANYNYTHRRFNNDLFNISIALIFSIDVALAWCGYIISSRWVDNQTVSAEPTVLGWLVCLLCYPPFQMYLGLYYAAPGEREVLQYSNQWLITIFATMMVLSYIVYMAATLWFGVRFSNLTNRGIIRKGPFAFIRHPAYASKNFAWWCVMFPAILFNATHAGWYHSLLQTLGLLLMTWIYYMRAITEERHLGVDPYYQAYCKQVRYRFIPGLI